MSEILQKAISIAGQALERASLTQERVSKLRTEVQVHREQVVAAQTRTEERAAGFHYDVKTVYHDPTLVGPYAEGYDAEGN